VDVKRFDAPQTAVDAAGEGDGVLLLAREQAKSLSCFLARTAIE
jgi:hypothetical protein